MNLPERPAASCLPAEFDVLVVGGDINGAGIARDLAGRGLSVCLVEQDDLASHTSSSSTKLIHGGLRYLEHREFGLVRKALGEREVLLRSAPHIMRPLRFVLPHDPSMRPAWLIRLGLFFYDHLARREVLPGSHGVDLRRSPLGVPLHAHLKRGFVYSDGWVDDARLVVLNAIDAQDKGATVLTRTRCTRAERHQDHWMVSLSGVGDGEPDVRQVRARALVNAAGPWAGRFLQDVAHAQAGEPLATRSLRLVKGSHIVVPRQFEHDHAYIFQNPDGRIIFAIPYERDFTLIGTTDQEVTGDPRDARCEADEVAYLCEQASRYLAQPIRPSDVVWTYSGVRPLLDDAAGDPSAVTRDYLLEQDTRAAPLMTVWGGKITTFRQLAEDAADAICRQLPRRAGAWGPAWTRAARLPGGDLSAWIRVSGRPDEDFEAFLLAVRARHPWLPAPLAHRLARAHGARIERVLAGARSMADLGAEVVPGLHEAELRHLQREEWALTAQDVLWRRSKLGLHLSAAQRDAVAHWLTQHPWAGPHETPFAAPPNEQKEALRA